MKDCLSQVGNKECFNSDYFTCLSKSKNGIIKYKRKFKETYSNDTIINNIELKFCKTDKCSIGFMFDIQISGLEGYQRISFDGKYFYFLSDKMKNITIQKLEDNHDYILNQLKYYTRNLQFFSNYSVLFNKQSEISQIDSLYSKIRNDQYTLYLCKSDSLVKKVIESIGKNEQNQYIEIEINFQDYDVELPDKWLINDNELPAEYFINNRNCKQSFKSRMCEGIPVPTLINQLNDSIIYGNQNTILILDFWYMNCAPCKKVAKILNEINSKYNSKVRIIGINSIDTNITELKQYCLENLSYEQIWDPDMDLRRKFDVQGFPSIFVINSSGIIVFADNYEDEIKDNLIKVIEANAL